MGVEGLEWEGVGGRGHFLSSRLPGFERQLWARETRLALSLSFPLANGHGMDCDAKYLDFSFIITLYNFGTVPGVWRSTGKRRFFILRVVGCFLGQLGTWVAKGFMGS